MPTNTERKWPWDGKRFRCGACGTETTLTYMDRARVDMGDADRIISINGDLLGYTGFAIFWSPCPSCDFRVEWVKPL